MNTLSTLALTLDGLHRYQESDSLYERALMLDPKSHLIMNNYGYSLAERGLQLERALKMSLQAIEAEPNNDSYLDTVGWVYFKLGHYEEAQKDISKAIGVGGASATVYEHMGDIHIQNWVRSRKLSSSGSKRWRRILPTRVSRTKSHGVHSDESRSRNVVSSGCCLSGWLRIGAEAGSDRQDGEPGKRAADRPGKL